MRLKLPRGGLVRRSVPVALVHSRLLIRYTLCVQGASMIGQSARKIWWQCLTQRVAWGTAAAECGVDSVDLEAQVSNGDLSY